MPRVDLFTTIHKALRAALFEAAAEVARADLRDPAAFAAVRARVGALLVLLEEHAEHEDALVFPVVAGAAPVLAADLAGEHGRLAGLQLELARLLERLERADDAERAALGARLHARMGALVAQHLAHMGREEDDANRILHAHRSDAELLELRARLQARLAPERLAVWMTHLLPAAAPAERALVLAGLARTRSAVELEALTRGARAALGAAALDAALAEAGLAAEARP
jgi:hypothetical protein